MLLGGSDFINNQALVDDLKAAIVSYNSVDNSTKLSNLYSIVQAAYDKDVDSSFAGVFKRAYEDMYHNKAIMKTAQSTYK